jgi:hypothetical protein
MTKLVYRIVQHDSGWAYKVGDVFSETFPSHELARAAADRAAREQRVAGGEPAAISWEDDNGVWHEEVTEGWDRPDTEVEG